MMRSTRPAHNEMLPRLQFLHAENSLNAVKLTQFRRLSTEALKTSLLKVRPDGTVLDGHHRLSILIERAEDIHTLPREIMEKEDHES